MTLPRWIEACGIRPGDIIRTRTGKSSGDGPCVSPEADRLVETVRAVRGYYHLVTFADGREPAQTVLWLNPAVLLVHRREANP